MSNCLNADQAGHFVEPDLGQNCLQRLSTDVTSRQDMALFENSVDPDQPADQDLQCFPFHW